MEEGRGKERGSKEYYRRRGITRVHDSSPSPSGFLVVDMRSIETTIC